MVLTSLTPKSYGLLSNECFSERLLVSPAFQVLFDFENLISSNKTLVVVTKGQKPQQINGKHTNKQ